VRHVASTPRPDSSHYIDFAKRVGTACHVDNAKSLVFFGGAGVVVVVVVAGGGGVVLVLVSWCSLSPFFRYPSIPMVPSKIIIFL